MTTKQALAHLGFKVAVCGLFLLLSKNHGPYVRSTLITMTVVLAVASRPMRVVISDVVRRLSCRRNHRPPE
jgi:hypothetical protein